LVLKCGRVGYWSAWVGVISSNDEDSPPERVVFF